jgi:hypothetical protein
MLEDPLQQIAGHADIKRVAPAGQDVGKIDLLFHGENLTQIVRDGKPFVLRRWLFLMRSN